MAFLYDHSLFFLIKFFINCQLLTKFYHSGLQNVVKKICKRALGHHCNNGKDQGKDHRETVNICKEHKIFVKYPLPFPRFSFMLFFCWNCLVCFCLFGLFRNFLWMKELITDFLQMCDVYNAVLTANCHYLVSWLDIFVFSFWFCHHHRMKKLILGEICDCELSRRTS